MLIYNFQKEFLGIDEKDLRILGFGSLEELRSEVTDFADLFIKKPGYIHNFQHVHWIDFIHYADESEEPKVLINVKSKTFTAILKVSTVFLIDNPASPAFMVYLHNLRPLGKSESETLPDEIVNRELPKVQPQEPKVFTTPVIEDAYDSTPLEIEIPEVPKEPSPVAEGTEEMFNIDELSLDVFDEQKNETNEQIAQPGETTQTIDQKVDIDETWDNGYRYDPHIASKELGLPLDLIEEFIQDFILQAKEFHDDIYNAIDKADVDNVKTLSHKLKGVAANLRIEDAHEVLSAVSATDDLEIIHENLDTFYKIIAKLAGEKIVASDQEIDEKPFKEVIAEDETEDSIELDFKDDEPNETLTLDFKDEIDEEENDDIIELDFKDENDAETLDIKDEDVPNKIEIPELADDNFFSNFESHEEEKMHEKETQEETPSYSKLAAAEEIGLDYESFDELFDDFVQESHTIFQNISTAIKNEDFDICRNEALKFKGMSDNMRLHEFTAELETLIHSTDKDAIIQAAEKIDNTITKISQLGA